MPKLPKNPKPPKERDPSIERRVLTVDQFTEAYSISRAQTYKLIKQGKIRCAMMGRRKLIPVDSAEEYIKSITV